MSGKVENKNILITGATSGLGYAMAEALLGEGATVAIASRSEKNLNKAVEQLKKVSGRVNGLLTHMGSCVFQSAIQWLTYPSHCC